MNPSCALRFLLPGLFLLLCSCTQDDIVIDQLQLSTKSFTFDNNENTGKVFITSNTSWTVSGNSGWCNINKSQGRNDDTLEITVKLNVSKQKRSANLILKTNHIIEKIHITQEAGTTDFHYQLPVVFHVLYNDSTDLEQNIDSLTLVELIQECNTAYNGGSGIDFQLKFVMATEDPNGKPLKEPGVNRIHWPEPIKMDCDKFINNHDNRNRVVWDMNKYINIAIFTFTEENVLGVTVLPFTASSNKLAGLEAGDRYFTQPITDHTHCVCINNVWIYKEEAPYTTMHELGHYLGLFHAFHVYTDANPDDYCDDTPNYDRNKYEIWYNTFKGPYIERYNRTDFDGKTFISDNIMDYFTSYKNRFTADQYTRVRHVLENSPLLPGPKSEHAQIRSKSPEPPYTIIR